MPFLKKFAWFAMTKVFSAWIVLDILLSTHLDNVGYDGLLPEYDFIVGNYVLIVGNFFVNCWQLYWSIVGNFKF